MVGMVNICPITISQPFLRYKDSLNPLIIHSMKRMILLLMCIIRKTICPKSQNDLSEDWGDNTAFFGRVVFGWFVYP